MKVALIGSGMVARTHLDAMARSETVSCAGVFSRNAETAGRLAQEYGVPVLKDFDAALESDFISLITPPDARRAYIEKTCAAGVPILMEKPLERTLNAAREIVEICEAANIPTGVVFHHRKRDGAKLLSDCMERIGSVRMIEISAPWWRAQSYYDEPGRGTYAKDGGGVLMTQAIHVLELALSLMGPVVKVQAMARQSGLHRMEAEDVVTAGLEFENGAIGSLFATTASFPGGKESITLHGDKARARLEGDVLSVDWHDGKTESFGKTAETGGGADPMAFKSDWHRGIIEDFAESLQDARPALITAREALQVHALIDALVGSSSDGKLREVERG